MNRQTSLAPSVVAFQPAGCTCIPRSSILYQPGPPGAFRPAYTLNEVPTYEMAAQVTNHPSYQNWENLVSLASAQRQSSTGYDPQSRLQSNYATAPPSVIQTVEHRKISTASSNSVKTANGAE